MSYRRASVGAKFEALEPLVNNCAITFREAWYQLRAVFDELSPEGVTNNRLEAAPRLLEAGILTKSDAQKILDLDSVDPDDEETEDDGELEEEEDELNGLKPLVFGPDGTPHDPRTCGICRSLEPMPPGRIEVRLPDSMPSPNFLEMESAGEALWKREFVARPSASVTLKIQMGPGCDCGGAKANTTHSHWCSSTEKI